MNRPACRIIRGYLIHGSGGFDAQSSLNAAASQFAAYGAASRLVRAPADPELSRGITEDAARIWKAGKGKGEALTAANAVNVVKKLGSRLSFPVQAGVSAWMGDTKVRRPGRALISQVQIAAIRPRLQPGDRAFRYMGRPYDFNFDFQTDSALVCTELVYKSYEPAPGFKGIRWKPEEVMGRTAIPANSMARQFDQEPNGPLEMVLFLDGQEKRGIAVEASAEEFRRSWKRPKWHVLVQEKQARQAAREGAEGLR